MFAVAAAATAPVQATLTILHVQDAHELLCVVVIPFQIDTVRLLRAGQTLDPPDDFRKRHDALNKKVVRF